MQPIDVYLMYCAIKAHFGESNYDFHQFSGKTKVSRDSFYKRNDRLFFVRVSRKYKEYDYIKAGYKLELPAQITADILKKRRAIISENETKSADEVEPGTDEKLNS